jgi:hypothetical protein
VALSRNNEIKSGERLSMELQWAKENTREKFIGGATTERSAT